MKGMKSTGSSGSLVATVRVSVPKVLPAETAGPSIHLSCHVVLKKNEQNHWPRSGLIPHHPCVPRKMMHEVTFSSESGIQTPEELLFIKCPWDQN